jgi:hypothetical protein
MYYYKFKFIYNEGYAGAVDTDKCYDGARTYEEFSHFENDIFARKRYKELFKEIPDRIISSHWRDAKDYEGYDINIEALHKGYNTFFKNGKIHYCYYDNAYKSAFCTNRKWQQIHIVENKNTVSCKSCWDKIQRSTFNYPVIWQHGTMFYHGTVSINIKDYNIQVGLFHENTIDKTNIKQNITDSTEYISLKKFLEKTMNTKLEKDYKIWLRIKL